MKKFYSLFLKSALTNQNNIFIFSMYVIRKIRGKCDRCLIFFAISTILYLLIKRSVQNIFIKFLKHFRFQASFYRSALVLQTILKQLSFSLFTKITSFRWRNPENMFPKSFQFRNVCLRREFFENVNKVAALNNISLCFLKAQHKLKAHSIQLQSIHKIIKGA